MDLEIFKELVLNEYVDRIYDSDDEEEYNIKDHDFIDSLAFNEEVKIFLKKYSYDI
jgi:hypothetical protein